MPLLMLVGTLVGGQMLTRAAVVAQAEIDRGNTDPWWGARIGLARFYAAHVLPQVGAQLAAVTAGAATVFALDEAML